MERRYYLRGLGVGIAVTAVIMGVMTSRDARMTDREVIARAKELSLVKRLCHRIIVMHDGNMVEAGVTQDIFYHPKEDYTRELISAIPKLEKIS